ncbi:hypothetical protein B0T17DRAFT_538108 [Bombardia bombarda]|uniref:Uncharacterized protein n=1 Tax=Bombardia bombarda TaxID=252184 RepID=A0AA39WN66_9PEZI|nr:hypothetical protein B0T17DRAFT_538108 [Bombardia bombarda]
MCLLCCSHKAGPTASRVPDGLDAITVEPDKCTNLGLSPTGPYYLPKNAKDQTAAATEENNQTTTPTIITKKTKKNMAGLALLRVVPLLSATSSVTFTLSEDTFIRPLTHTAPSPASVELRRHANRILPSHGRWTRRGLAVIFITYPLSIATAIANLARRHDNAQVDFSPNAPYNARAAAAFYLAGLVFSVIHFPFGPRAMSLLKRIRKDTGGVEADVDPAQDNTASMASWLRINAIRGVVADVPSWVCYFAAFLFAMSS